MKNTRKAAFIALMVVISMLAAACAKPAQEPADAPTADPAVALTISAAASLKGAMEDIRTAYAAEKPNVTITCNFGSSGSLQQQIEQGAEVDIFFSAAAKQMDALQEKSLILEDTRKNILENKIVLVAPKGTTAVTDFTSLALDGVKKIALGEVSSVPVGQYSEEVLTKMNLMEAVKPKLVYGKDVKEVLAWVETGNADAGMVYETDSKASDKVSIIAYAPDDSHKPVVYPAAVIKASKNIEASKDFMSFLCSEKAKTIFEKYGFAFIIE